MNDLRAGSRFQGHALGAVLARSALTVVFLAVERRSGALLAVKAPAPELAGEPRLRERLRHERAVGWSSGTRTWSGCGRCRRIRTGLAW
jgi:hypothetical protein